MPKNSSVGIIIGGFSLVFGFAVIWHIWWLAIIGGIGIITSLIIRLSDDNTEYKISAKEIARIESDLEYRGKIG